jgi:hypothetical protein
VNSGKNAISRYRQNLELGWRFIFHIPGQVCNITNCSAWFPTGSLHKKQLYNREVPQRHKLQIANMNSGFVIRIPDYPKNNFRIQVPNLTR